MPRRRPNPSHAAEARRRVRAKGPKSEAAAAGGYRGVGGSYDSYGNKIRKDDAVETLYVQGSDKLRFRHVMGAKRGPRRVTGRGASD